MAREISHHLSDLLVQAWRELCPWQATAPSHHRARCCGSAVLDGVQAGMPGGAQGPLGMLRASQMVQQLLPGGQIIQMPQPEEEKKPQFITELEINDFPQHARWKVRLSSALHSLTNVCQKLAIRCYLLLTRTCIQCALMTAQ